MLESVGHGVDAAGNVFECSSNASTVPVLLQGIVIAAVLGFEPSAVARLRQAGVGSGNNAGQKEAPAEMHSAGAHA